MYQKHTQTETRRNETDKKIDTKQKFTLTHTHNLAISTSVRCFIVAINTRKLQEKSQHSCSYASQTIIYRMLRHCPRSFIILTHTKTQHECSISLNLAILFALLQKKSTTYLERTKVKHKIAEQIHILRGCENRSKRKPL